MTLTDSVLALLLALHIHGTDEAIRATARRCAKHLPRSKRSLMYSIADAAHPLAFVELILDGLAPNSNPSHT